MEDMKKPAIILLLLSVIAFSASAGQSVPAVSSYFSISSGYTAVMADEGFSQGVPLGFQSGVLSNSSDGSYALGFGTRMDLSFGAGASSSMLALDMNFGIEGLIRVNDMNFGIEGLIRVNSMLSFDFLAGLGIGVMETKESAYKDSVVTMGPAASAALRFSPGANGIVSIDFGLAAYGHFAVGEDYSGLSVTPFVGFTFDFTAFPYIPHYVTHLLIY